jgi:hypothetical protein
MDDTEEEANVVEFTTENKEFLSRVLAHGGPEARGYVLAVLAHGGTVREIEAVQEELDKIKQELAG